MRLVPKPMGILPRFIPRKPIRLTNTMFNPQIHDPRDFSRVYHGLSPFLGGVLPILFFAMLKRWFFCHVTL